MGLTVAGWVLIVFLAEGPFADENVYPTKQDCKTVARELQKKEVPRPIWAVCVPADIVTLPLKQ